MNHTTNPAAVIYDALEGLQGTTHHLPPGTRQAVAEHLARVLPAVSPSAVVSADRPALRDLVARVLRPWLVGGDEADVARRVGHATAAVMAVLPERADRATLLREAADIAESLRQFERCTGPRRAAQTSENVGILRVADHLRQLAVEADASRVAAEEQPAETQTVDRAAVLHDAAIVYAEILGNVPDHSADPRYWQAIRDVIVGLRRMAAEQTAARPVVGEQPDTQEAP